MKAIAIDTVTMRRFVLGKQGLWPGRRWAGKAGLAEALHTIGSVQMDPLNVVARSHQIALWGRIDGYQPTDLTALMYEERRFFDYGGVLCIRPMHELPFWHMHMERRKEEPRWATFAGEHPDLLSRLRSEVMARGPLGNRDVAGISRQGTFNYRGGKDSSVGLYYLWLTGELMIHHRNDFERVYDLRERIAPAEFAHAATNAEAEAFFARKAIAHKGIISERNWRSSVTGYIQRKISSIEAKEWLTRLVTQGVITPVTIEEIRESHYMLTDDLADLRTVAAGDIPDSWSPIGPATQDEVVFLAPLEVVSSSGRAKRLFDFDYLWEVYKPLAKRRWGYYTLPIMWDDRLVARLDPKFDRASGNLIILGFWLEDDVTGYDAAFVRALANGLRRFQAFLGADRIDLTPIATHAIHDSLFASLDA
ncbi:MAG: winged helix-turn-helix domain-containing protein [Thermomicrobiales bacterium]